MDLTVAIPTYNRLDKLKIAIDSCLQQTQQVKVIVSDNSKGFYSSGLKKEYPSNVKFLHRPDLKGSFENMYSLGEIIETDFGYILADDDIILPECSNNVLSSFSKEPKASLYIGGIIYSKSLACYNSGLIISPPFDIGFFTDTCCVIGKNVAFLNMITSTVPIPGLAFKTQSLQGFYKISPKTDLYAERCLQAYLASKSEYVIVDKRIGAIKLDHQDQLARVLLKNGVTKYKEIAEYLNFIIDIVKNFEYSDEDKKFLKSAYGQSLNWQGDLYMNELRKMQIPWVNNILSVIKPELKKKLLIERVLRKVKDIFFKSL
jgi:hypothetical protein